MNSNFVAWFHNPIKIPFLSSVNFYRLAVSVFWLLLLVFSFNNFIIYNPEWGYDGLAHIAVIKYYLTHHAIPPPYLSYAASNPPFYYIIAASLLGLFGSIKVVQFFSLLLYFMAILCLNYLLTRVSSNKFLNLALLAFFAFCPLSLSNAYMTFNYSLGYVLGISSITLMTMLSTRNSISLRGMALLSVLIGLGIITSLTNVAIFLAAVIMIIFSPYLQTKVRMKNLLVLMLGIFIIVSPYFIYKTQVLNLCYFCTTNHSQTPKTFSPAYPLKFYYTFNLSDLKKPYYPLGLYDGLWNILHETLYGDYFNYLVDHRYNKDVIAGDRFQTSYHYIDKNKITNLSRLNYLGLGFSPFLAWALFLSTRRSLKFIFSADKSAIQTFTLVTIIYLTFMQFLVYMHLYPNYINIHAGYLYPTVFALLVLMAKTIRSPLAVRCVGSIAVMFALYSCYTFWLV